MPASKVSFTQLREALTYLPIMASTASRDRAAKERARAAAKSLIKEGSGWDARRLATAVKKANETHLHKPSLGLKALCQNIKSASKRC